MIIRTKDFKNKVALSSSRIKKFQHCYQSYFATYFLKLPDNGNPGSLRGSTCHDVLELLNKPRRKELVNRIIKDKTLKSESGLWKFVTAVAKKYRVDDRENIDLIDKFIVTALNCDFWGPEGTIHTHIEKDFDIEVEGDEVNFRIRGFIDKFFIIRDGDVLVIDGADYKSSKAKLNADDLRYGQAAMYQLALSLLYPKIKMRNFKFIFLKFPKDPYQVFEVLSDDALEGYMIYLTHIQSQINAFSEKDIPANYGKLNEKMKFLCGPAKSGWICPHQNPLDYYVLLRGSEIVKSSFKDDFEPKKDEIVEKRWYSGCSYFFDKQGKRIRG